MENRGVEKNWCCVSVAAAKAAATRWTTGELLAAHAAFSVGRSTSSQVERLSHFTQRGKLASFSSSTSSPQQSEAYNPDSTTSCPVFILAPKKVVVCLTPASRGPLCCTGMVSYSLPP